MAVANIGGAFQAGLGVGDARRANIELQEKLRIQKKSEILDAAKTTSETMSSFLKDIQQQREKIARSGGPEKLAKYDQEFVIPQTKNIAKSYLPVLQGGVQGGYISPQEAQVIMKQMETMGTLSDPLAEPENVAARTEAENQAASQGTAQGNLNVESSAQGRAQSQFETGQAIYQDVESARQQGELVKGFINTENGKQVRGRFVNGRAVDAVTGEPLGSEWVELAKPQMVDTAAGLTSSQAGKAKLELATAIESNAIFNAIAEDTIALLEQSDTPTLAVGSLTKLTDAFVDQLSQVTKVNLFSDGSKINPAMLDKNNISEASRSAALAGRYDTNVASLAAMIAFANNPDGKISDADFRMAQNMISGVTSKAVSIQKIKQVQRNINFRLEAAKEKARFLGVDTSSAPGSAPRQEYSPESDEVYFDDLS